MTIHKFEVGVMWEDGPWTIAENRECSEFGGSPCPHCHSHSTETHRRPDGSTYTEKKWLCPAVVIVENEGGHNSTGLCLDCLLTAAETIRRNSP